MKPIVLVAAMVAILVAVVAAVGLMGGDQEDYGITEGVVYFGNGGETLDGKSFYGITDETILESWFTYDGHVQAGWNTKSDGTGTSYNTGDSIDYGNGIVKLYAMWDYAFSAYFHSSLSTELEFYVGNSEHNSRVSIIPVALSGSTAFLIVTGGENWEVDDNNVFHGVSDDGKYSLTVTVTFNSGDPVAYTITSSGVPAIEFDFDCPVNVDIYTDKKPL